MRLEREAVSVFLGHSDPCFTLRTYVHLLPEDLPEVPFGAQLPEPRLARGVCADVGISPRTGGRRKSVRAPLVVELSNMYEDDGIDRSWFGPVLDVTGLYPDAAIWELWRRGEDDWEDSGVSAPELPGVYIWQSATEGVRPWGERSDIKYIGSTGNLWRRLRYHELREFDLEVAWRVCWRCEEARELEDVLLRRYRSIHGRLPPRNRINAARRRP